MSFSEENLAEGNPGERYRSFWRRALKNAAISALVFDFVFVVFAFLALLRATDIASSVLEKTARGLAGVTVWGVVVGIGCTWLGKPKLSKILALLLVMGIICWIIVTRLAIPASGIEFADEETRRALTFFGVATCMFLCLSAQLASLIPRSNQTIAQADYSSLSDDELRAQIKTLEAQGHTARSSSVLDALNREQTNRLSDSELLALLRSRAAEGKPVAKLAAAARERGLSI